MSAEMWNVLHDGAITGCDGRVPGNLTLTVEIDYLRHMFSKDSDCIKVSLSECSLFEYRPFNASEFERDLSAISRAEPEILSARLVDQDIVVDCASGLLRVRYKGFSLTLDNGTRITLPELEQKAQQYWNASQEKGKC